MSRAKPKRGAVYPPTTKRPIRYDIFGDPHICAYLCQRVCVYVCVASETIVFAILPALGHSMKVIIY